MRTLSILLIGTCLVVVGCDGTSSSPGTPSADSGLSVVPAVSETVDVGCAKCMYKLAGAEDCSQVAGSVDGKPLLLTGVELNAHELGLCKATKSALVKGDVEGDKFVATDVELQ